MWEIFGIGCLIVIVAFFVKEASKKVPIGCLVVFIFIGGIMVKSYMDLKKEEKEQKEYSRLRNLEFDERVKSIREEESNRLNEKQKHLRKLLDSTEVNKLKTKYGDNFIYHLEELKD